MAEKEGGSSDNGSGEKGGGERQEAPFSASQQAWLMELFEKTGSANQPSEKILGTILTKIMPKVKMARLLRPNSWYLDPRSFLKILLSCP